MRSKVTRQQAILPANNIALNCTLGTFVQRWPAAKHQHAPLTCCRRPLADSLGNSRQPQRPPPGKAARAAPLPWMASPSQRLRKPRQTKTKPVRFRPEGGMNCPLVLTCDHANMHLSVLLLACIALCRCPLQLQLCTPSSDILIALPTQQSVTKITHHI